MDLMDSLDLAIFKCLNLGRNFLLVVQNISDFFFNFRYILLSIFQCTEIIFYSWK